MQAGSRQPDMKNLQCGMRSRSYWCSRSHILFFLHTLRIQNVLKRVKLEKKQEIRSISPHFPLKVAALVMPFLHSEALKTATKAAATVLTLHRWPM
jgi:hypothetical protein